MYPRRPVLISAVQYHDALSAQKIGQPDLIPVVRRLGADGIEVRDNYWRDKYREIAEIRRLLDVEGMTVTYATSATLFDSQLGELFSLIDDAAALGASIVRVFYSRFEGVGNQSAWDIAARAVEAARAVGVTLAVENLGKGEGRTAKEILAVVEAVPGLRTNVDIGNYHVGGEDVSEAIQVLGEHIVYAHLKDIADDPDGTYLGGGRMELDKILSVLNALPQTIPYCFEFTGSENPELSICASLKFLQRAPQSIRDSN